MRTATTSVAVLRVVVRSVERLGVPPSELLGAVGLTPAALEQRDVRVPATLEAQLLEAAERLTGDEVIGLRVAQSLTAGTYDVLGYAWRTSATLGEALDRLRSFHRLIHESTTLQTEVEGDVARITHGASGEPLARVRPLAQLALGAMVVVGRQITGEEWAPNEVEFQHAPPRDCAEYERLFRAPARFDAPYNRLVLDATLLRRPLPHADPTLCGLMERYARELADRLPAGQTTSEQVRLLVRQSLAGGDIRAEALACKLHMSARSLQRVLAAEQTSLRELVDGLRRDLALRYLAEPDLALGEVAFLLGFSELGSFWRAFRRWTGRTPAAARRLLRSGRAHAA